MSGSYRNLFTKAFPLSERVLLNETADSSQLDNLFNRGLSFLTQDEHIKKKYKKQFIFIMLYFMVFSPLRLFSLQMFSGCYRKCGIRWWRKDTCWLSQLIMFLYKSIVYLLLLSLYIFHIIMQGSTISHLPSVLISKDFSWNFSSHFSRRSLFSSTSGCFILQENLYIF